jgi:hypothetical protein
VQVQVSIDSDHHLTGHAVARIERGNQQSAGRDSRLTGDG